MAILWVIFAMLYLKNFSIRAVVYAQYMMYVVDVLLMLNAFAYGGIVFRILTVAITVIDVIAFIVCAVLVHTSPCSDNARDASDCFVNDGTVDDYMNRL